ncbi:MAG: phosphate propanoyltransferase [Coriobacteriales bacterium]|jgi:propanediol utilization protein|nr:phosphate propanoyltransferase [Coriobacteriales bacterium]
MSAAHDKLNGVAEALTDLVMAEVRAELASQGYLQVEASGRHVHLSVEDARKLFGEDYALIWVKYLSQPGQFVGEQRMTLVGPAGRLENAVVIGPERRQTQIEVSRTDATLLGLDPPCRDSGNLENTPGIRIENGEAWVETNGGLIIAERHIHMKPEAAAALGLTDGARVDFELSSPRPVSFRDVKVRVAETADNFMHIDYDEANAAGFTRGMFGCIRT